MALRKNAFNTVTPLSKTFALILFIVLPFLGFYLGREYQKRITVIPVEYKREVLLTAPTPTPTPALYYSN